MLVTVKPESPLEGSDAASFAGGFRTFIESVSLDAAGARLLLGLNNGSAVLYDVEGGEMLARLVPPKGAVPAGFHLVRAVCHSPDGSLLAVPLGGRSVGVWDREGRELRFELAHPTVGRRVSTIGFRDALVTSLAFGHDGRQVFAGFADGTAASRRPSRPWIGRSSSSPSTKQVRFSLAESDAARSMGRSSPSPDWRTSESCI